MTAARPFACPNGHTRPKPYRPGEGCRHCRDEAALAEIAALMAKAEPSLTDQDARVLVEGAAGSALARNQLRDWLAAQPDPLRSGDSACPAAGSRLISALADRGVDVRLPRCLDCGRVRPLPGQVDQGRVCQNCYQRRRVEPCARCGGLKKVTTRDDEGRAICLRCHTLDPATWRRCGRCGELAQPVTTANGLTIGRCCYVAPGLRCTVCGVRKGRRPWKTRRRICSACADQPRTPCARCGLDAPDDGAGEPLCAQCRTDRPRPCSGCGLLTVTRNREGAPRCSDCYERPVGTCGRCGRDRAIVRLGRGVDPDLCAVCWKGPVMVCEACSRVAPCRGERKGRMLCVYCRPVTPQTCAHCGEPRAPMAHWHEGPVCAKCYYRALAAKGDCPGCGQHRRLRLYPGFDGRVCADCAGQPATHVCERCGVEDCLYERGVCARCVARHRLEALLGDATARRANGLQPLFDAFVASTDPRAVIDWLLKSHKAIDVLGRIARREVPLTHGAIDELEPGLGVRTARHLENLLAATGTLPTRDPVLAATERWSDRFLASVDDPQHEQLLRTYVRWQILRPLRESSQRAPLIDSRGYAARARVKSVAAFLDWLLARQRHLADCRQADLDEWAASQPPHRTRPLHGFAAWATRRKAMPRLDVPTRRNNLPAAPVDSAERWPAARRLLHGAGIGPDDRVAGALAIIYAQPLHKVSRLKTSDLTVEPDRVTVSMGNTAIELSEPLAGHARELLAQRNPQPRKACVVDDAGWLFPGADPGRPIGAGALGNRLRRHGVKPGAHRLAALHQLAAEMPPALVADLLGISPITANVWARLAGRTWADYPQMREADTI